LNKKKLKIFFNLKKDKKNKEKEKSYKLI
jgi:hypothetical protein